MGQAPFKPVSAEVAAATAEQWRWALGQTVMTLGVRQRELARAMGVHEVTVARWMGGTRLASMENWQALVRVVARWIGAGRAGAMPIAQAFVAGPLWQCARGEWARILFIDASLLRDAAPEPTGYEVGYDLLRALGDPAIRSAPRELLLSLTAHRIRLELLNAITLQHGAFRMVESLSPALQDLVTGNTAAGRRARTKSPKTKRRAATRRGTARANERRKRND
jgi:hypothetical protein